MQKHGYKIEADAVKKVADGHIQKTNKSQRKYDAKREYHKTDEYKEKRKRAIKIGATAAGTTLAVYGGYKISKHLKSKAGRLSYEMGKKYAEEHFFNKADIANPIKYQHLMDAGRQTLQNTDKRTKKVSKSTIEAIKFLRDPNSSIVDGELLRWY